MDLAVIFALFLINTVDCNDGKQSVSSEKGDPLARLLLNQIKRIDSALEKLQDGEKELQKNIVAVEKKFLEKEANLKTVAIEPVLQLSYKTKSVYSPAEVKAVQKSLRLLKVSSESHFKALKKNILQQENDTISKTDLINRQISQLSSQITSINNTDEVESIKKAIAVLEKEAETHLTADDVDKPNKELSELKVKVLDLERQLKVLQSKKKCPDDWKKLNKSCYYFGKDQLIWNAAKDRCIKLSGQLVKIESSEENQMLLLEARKVDIKGNVWMGANDISREGTWRWVSDYSRVHYTNWHSGEPNNTGGNEDCGILSLVHDFRWNDGRCSHPEGYYICEKEL